VLGVRRGGLAKCATARRKRNLAITPRRFRPTGLVKEAVAYVWRVAGPDPRGDSNGNLIFKFQGYLEFGKTLKNSIRRFRRNLGMGIFPKFF
jgi:hypothetical protein